MAGSRPHVNGNVAPATIASPSFARLAFDEQLQQDAEQVDLQHRADCGLARVEQCARSCRAP